MFERSAGYLRPCRTSTNWNPYSITSFLRAFAKVDGLAMEAILLLRCSFSLVRTRSDDRQYRSPGRSASVVVRGQIVAARSGDSYELRAVRRGELDLGAEGVTVASTARQVDGSRTSGSSK